MKEVAAINVDFLSKVDGLTYFHGYIKRIGVILTIISLKI